MRVRNNEIFNVSCNTGHAGGAKFMNIPAGATIEMADAEWKTFEKSAEGMLENGILEITKSVVKTDEEVAKENAKQLDAAKKLIADAQEAEKKAKEAADKLAKDKAAKNK